MADEGRVSQLPIEVPITPLSTGARVTQLPIEIPVSPSDTKGRVSQLAIEVVISQRFDTFQGYILD